MGLCGQCAWCDDGMYCRKNHKDVPYFGEKSYYTTQEEFRLLFAQEVTKIEQDTNLLNQDTNKMAENANIKTKVCKVCGKELPIDQFRPNPKCKDGHLDTCYECLNNKIKETNKRKEEVDVTKELHLYADEELVQELRERGWEVKCTKTISL